MGRASRIITFGFALLLPSNLLASLDEDFNWQPKSNELLSKPITLKCDGFSLVEAKKIKITDDVLKALNKACLLSLDRFPKFIESKKWSLTKKQLNIKISLLPALPFDGGKEFRNLNDTKWRFSKLRPNGECCFFGFYLNDYNHVFLRNDVLISGDINHNFLNTMVHEIGHVQSVQFGIRNKYLNDSKDLDEEMIQNFTKWALKEM